MSERLPMLRFIEDPGDGGGKPPEDPPEGEQTFTQADVDKIIGRTRTEERRKAAEKFADYDDLKAKAGQSKTLEDRLAEIEKRAIDAEAAALRSDIAAEHGISAEDRDLFLTGADKDTLEAQAKRLAQREADRKKQGNRVPKEGTNPQPKDDEMRTFTRQLFDSSGS